MGPHPGTPLDIPALIGALTLEEKAALLDGADFWRTQAVERLGIPAVTVTDGPHGLRKQAGETDHLGLNDSVPATCFPPAAGLASSWDPELLTRVGAALGRECRAAEVAVLLGPGVNMKRSPLCGRNFEYFSEDPLLAGDLGAALVDGVQSQGVGTSLKHFAANNQETDRMTVSADVDERTLREIYLPAFERIVTGSQPWTVMCAYNRINGTYASEDPWLLTGVLRDEWGFRGLVVSDWGAVHRRDAGLAAGLDLEMPSSGGAGTRIILDAVHAGTLSEKDVDRAAIRVLELIDRALPALGPGQTFDVGAHHTLAREAATASAVLLKNDGILPLARTGGPIAVIGEFARTPRFQGAGSSQVNPTRVDTALDALRDALDGAREVVFAPGFTIQPPAGEGASTGNAPAARGDGATTDNAPAAAGLVGAGVGVRAADSALVDEAVRAAAGAEVAVVFLGLPPAAESEGYDRTHLDLPADQIALLHAVADANPRVVVVLSNGSVVTVAPWQDRAGAVLEGWLLGQAGGAATADLLLGTATPAGKLAETIPVRYEDNPAIGAFPGEHGHVRYGEGLLMGYRWYDAHRLPVAYPFGHGLSYTSFAYDDLAVAVEGHRVRVTLTVTNTGPRPGTEVVQVYVTDPVAGVYRPEQELRGFTRITLAPGESRTATVALGDRAFAYWHPVLRRWTVEGGSFGIRVGASSRDIRLETTIELPGDDVTTPLTPEATVDAWLAHPAAGAWLRERLGDGIVDAMFFDPANGQMMRAIPLQRLSRFPGFPITEPQVEEAAARFS
ncbi:glycoside hydrolase family 3 C-terminal domain-containing protein [Couchioplanes caeruleus]|uniref:Exo-alpha-(1->6)-L-arabinopyranosidase n=2 Tax=Couchioplanes caeruleus TaxID=56438 RepID=A0A1K0GX14_9ACTN|nr:glycoside hydrolase family 3 C-terminal domain-containing protein [Couchioplanes caeruleus]OJF13955.1 glycosyl hydrolase [Couchioplanes caeruleus subsp. caeruleus]ROP29113.1 beta-glucosidase [Couchioplanes caeruleus]